jgi:hypothetical protein
MQNASKQLFVQRFENVGPAEFYTFLTRYADTRISENAVNKGTSPEVELLNYATQFIQIYRRENKEIYREIAFCFRRAAHKAYRQMVKNKLIKRNNKFLNLVE